MRIKTLFVRFYKSFNYDYLRKVHPDSKFDTWDMIDGAPYPYVRVPLDPQVTTVVGANESGKSHLLTAIEKGLTGQCIEREDFCRYSQFFTVEEGKTRWPEFGFEFADLNDDDRTMIACACGVATPDFDRFLLFRTDRNTLTVYLPSRGRYSTHPVQPGREKDVEQRLPRVVRLRPDVALPDSIPLLSLLEESDAETPSPGASIPRHRRFAVLDQLAAVAGQAQLFETDESVQKNAPAIRASMSSILQAARSSNRGKSADIDASIALARNLIYKVANIDRSAILDLYDALRSGNDGHANGLMQKINDHLAATLNFPHWWVQDRDFRLAVTPRDHDLVLTIHDRTGTHYSFLERSGGLKFFLSYYIQYRAHTPSVDPPEVLLMDEPDAHLSSEGQQDLLKIFDAFANPARGIPPVQVVYVTHSPFLIDKNHAKRIRVLEKGVSDEGTRVVRDAARNHYEPLRSAFGAYVGETTFIGNCNLVVEGLSDQVLIAGAATQLRGVDAIESETLDLNHLTIVPAGSASHVPYLVFLARGRDVEQPAVVVLLDSDSEGASAVAALKRGGPRNRKLLPDNHVLLVGEIPQLAGAIGCVVSIEDLLPLELIARAASQYAVELCDVHKEDANAITPNAITERATPNQGAFHAIASLVAELPAPRPCHLDKVGFARYVLSELDAMRPVANAGDATAQECVTMFDRNFKNLFRSINERRRRAEREARGERVSARVERAKRSFILDHPSSATKEHAALLLEEIDAVLDASRESDEIRTEMQRISRDFRLDADLKESIADFQTFLLRLETLKYAGRLATQLPSSVVPPRDAPPIHDHSPEQVDCQSEEVGALPTRAAGPARPAATRGVVPPDQSETNEPSGTLGTPR